MADPKGNMGAGMEDFTGQKGLSKLLDTGNKGMGSWLKNFKEIFTIAEKTRDVVKQTADIQAGKGSTGSKLGAAKMGPGAFSEQIGLKGGKAFAQEIGYQGTRGSMLGGVATGIMAAGSLGMGMMPNTMTAVGQRLVAEQIGMFSAGNRNPRDIIKLANSMTGGAATSAGAPTRAMGIMLSQGGYGLNSGSTKNMMNNLAGVSAISGMSMEQVASSTAGANGMTFLRLGVRLRDQNGNIRPYTDLVNEIYPKIWRGDPKNPELIFNRQSREGFTLAQITGGDEGLYNILATLLVQRAKNKKPLKNELKTTKGALGMAGNANGIMQAGLAQQGSENKLLGATESGLVSGYKGALNTSTAINNGLSGMAELLPGVVDGLGKLKGFLETFPSTGNAASTVTGLAGNLGTTLMAGRMLGVGGGGGGAGAGGMFGKMGGAGGAASVAGLGLSVAGHFVSQGSKKGSGRSRAGNAMKWAGAASILNFLGPEIGIPAMIAAGAAGAVLGGGEGNQPMNSNMGGGASTLIAPGTVVSSGYATRKDPNGSGTQHHNGIDYAMPVGSPVIAAADGKVVVIKRQPGRTRSFGLYMVLEHKGFYTYYGHLSATVARLGQQVNQGDVIAKSGGEKGGPNSGSSTGPHLHFEVRKSLSNPNSSVNPTSLFGKLKQKVSSIFGADSKINTEQVQNKYTNYLSSTGISSGSNPYTGTRLADLLNAGSALNAQDIMNFDAMGATKNMSTEDRAALSQYTPSVGDKGGMAFGSRKGLMSALYNQGFRDKGLSTAFAVALAESGGMSHAHNGVGRDDSYGVFQINMTNKDPKSPNMGKNRLKQFHLKNNDALYDPNTNIRSAYEISNKGTWWKQWATYNSGKFTNYLDDAQLAARQAGVPLHYYGSGRTQEGPAYLHKDEMVLHKQEADKIRGGLGQGLAAGGVNINMVVNIAKAGEAEVHVLLQRFKEALAHDKVIAQIGRL